MLGRFLEFSIATTDILASWEFYRALGYTGIDGYDVYPHRYGVLSDGRAAIGLHEADLPALSLTYVRPDLAAYARTLRAAGLVPSHERLSDERFHEIAIEPGDGVAVRLLEARTYSPAHRAAPSLLAWFDELVLPARDMDATCARWEQLGFIAVPDEGPHVTLTSDHLSLALCVATRGARPALRYSVEDAADTRASLEALGLECDEALAAALGVTGGYAVVAPEGTPLIVAPGRT